MSVTISRATTTGRQSGQDKYRAFGELNARIVPSKYLTRKGIMDRVLAALLLLPGLPLLALLVVLVRLTSRGPAIYHQIRVGLNGRTFTMYKIRTMRIDAEARTGAVWAISGDRRITPIGRVIRRLHLDELPQLFNVLKGEMSLVGPRPERPEFTTLLGRDIPGYLNRLAVLPGVTGLAQINLPPDTNLQSVQRKLLVDLDYVEHGSLLMDVGILICTLFRLSGISSSPLVRLLGLKRTPIILSAPRLSASSVVASQSLALTAETEPVA